MTVSPTDPTPNDPHTPAGALPGTPGQFEGNSPVDPAGTWQKFLSMSGSPASKKDVEQFFKTLLNFFNLVIKQADEAHKREMQHQKDVMSGND